VQLGQRVAAMGMGRAAELAVPGGGRRRRGLLLQLAGLLHGNEDHKRDDQKIDHRIEELAVGDDGAAAALAAASVA